MRKKASTTSVRRGPGRPRKTTTAKQAAAKGSRGAKKKTRGRPKKAGIVKTAARRVSKAGRSLANAAKTSLWGTVHGLTKWVPEKGDLLITKTCGAFRLGNSSWRRDKSADGLADAQTSQAVGETTRRRPGRPRKVRTESEQVIPIKAGRPQRISPETQEAIDELEGRVKQVSQGADRKAL